MVVLLRELGPPSRFQLLTLESAHFFDLNYRAICDDRARTAHYHRSNDIFLDTRVSKLILNERANLVRGRRSYALFLEHKVADGDRTHDFGGYLSFKLFVDDTDERILEILKSYFRN